MRRTCIEHLKYFFLGIYRSRDIVECIWWRMMLRDTIFETNRMRFYRITVLSDGRKKKKEREKEYELLLRGTSLSCWTVTTDYLWTSNNEKLKVRSGVESVDKNVLVGMLVLEILRVAEKFKVQRACASEVGGCKWSWCWMVAQWLPASDIARDATLRDSISAKTRIWFEARWITFSWKQIL